MALREENSVMHRAVTSREDITPAVAVAAGHFVQVAQCRPIGAVCSWITRKQEVGPARGAASQCPVGPKITGPNLLAPIFSVSALVIKQFGRLFCA